MTPRPVAPESETPETDEFSNPSTEGDNDSFVAIEHYNSLLEHARSLERRLSLAQTEIKGHMRIEDELREEIVKLSAKRSEEILERGSLHMTQMREHLAQAQARIAELEQQVSNAKEICDALSERHQRDKADVERYLKLKAAITVPMAMQSFLKHMNWHPDTFKMGIDEAIDAALKSHA